MNVLVIFPSNIGDMLLTLPAVRRLRRTYSKASFTAVCSPHTCGMVRGLCRMERVEAFHKDWTWRRKFAFVSELRGRFDVCADFKHTLIPLLIAAPRHTPFLRFSKPVHKKDMYLDLITPLLRGIPPAGDDSATEVSGVDTALNIKPGSIFIAPATRSSDKRWPAERFAALIERLGTTRPVVIVASGEDRPFVDAILSGVAERSHITNLTGVTGFEQLPGLMALCARLVICCDSAPLHVASFVNIPTVALFGPTDPALYGPYADKHRVLRASSRRMEDITLEDVITACCGVCV